MTVNKAARESVRDYPRPPRLEPSRHRIRVAVDGIAIADSTRAWRVLETFHPPVYYVPPEDVRLDLLVPDGRRTVCEYKGEASYWTIATGTSERRQAAWSYPQPRPGYEQIRDCLAFYAGRVEACYVDEERVEPQPGDFYGGWITSNIDGPIKGAPGTVGW